MIYYMSICAEVVISMSAVQFWLITGRQHILISMKRKLKRLQHRQESLALRWWCLMMAGLASVMMTTVALVTGLSMKKRFAEVCQSFQRRSMKRVWNLVFGLSQRWYQRIVIFTALIQTGQSQFQDVCQIIPAISLCLIWQEVMCATIWWLVLKKFLETLRSSM